MIIQEIQVNKSTQHIFWLILIILFLVLLWRVGLTDIKGYYESIFPGNDIKFV